MTIGGLVDYSGLPSSISSAISSATVSAYLDNPAHTPIVTDVPVAAGAWSTAVPANTAGQPVRLVLTLNLTISQSINSQIQTVLTGSASDLDFAPLPAPIATAINGMSGINGYDGLLFVPASSENYSLQAGSNTYISFYVYDGLTGNQIAYSSQSYLTSTLIVPLSAETPYIIRISPDGQSFQAYQFYADLIPPVTFGGTVNFSELTSWSADSAGILVFSSQPYPYSVLQTGAVSLPGGGWSINGSVPAEVFIALVGLSSEGAGVLETQTVNVSGGNNAINFSPEDSDKNVATGAWHDRSSNGAVGEWLLWIPEATGEYVLDAENISMDPYMYLYDGLTGNQIAFDDDGGDSNNSSRIYCSVTAGHPYLIRVRAYSNGSGTFRFKAEEVTQ
jgi:hypothetical protein